jgi:hypothetical protein
VGPTPCSCRARLSFAFSAPENCVDEQLGHVVRELVRVRQQLGGLLVEGVDTEHHVELRRLGNGEADVAGTPDT